MPFDEAVDMAYLQLHAWLIFPAVVGPFQEAVEEALLQVDAVIRVEMGPVLEAMRLEPLVLRGGAHEALEIPTRVQALPTPVRRGKKRHRDLVPERRALAVIVVVERVSTNLLSEIAAIRVELAIGKHLVSAYRLARHPAFRAALAEAVLHGLHLHVVPVGPEGTEDAAVMRHVPVPVGGAFPDAHRRQVRGLQ